MRFSFKRAMGKKIFFTAFILEKLPNNISIVQSKFDKSDVIFDITQWIIKSMLKKKVHVSVVCNAEVSELTCWFWPIQVEQWMKLSSSPQSETEGRGERGELINKTREDRENNVSLLIKTGNQTQKHRHQTITVAESSTQMAINPPTFLSLPATHTHTPPVQKQSYIRARGPLVSDGCLCGGLESHGGQFGFAPFFPAALGIQTDLRIAPSCSLTCTNTQSKCDCYW